ncbi:MAG: hypothetical protein V4629_12535 [Pseudomonadota bacterium]
MDSRFPSSVEKPYRTMRSQSERSQHGKRNEYGNRISTLLQLSTKQQVPALVSKAQKWMLQDPRLDVYLETVQALEKDPSNIQLKASLRQIKMEYVSSIRASQDYMYVIQTEIQNLFNSSVDKKNYQALQAFFEGSMNNQEESLNSHDAVKNHIDQNLETWFTHITHQALQLIKDQIGKVEYFQSITTQK